MIVTLMESHKLARKLSWLVGLILVLIPFHAFLTVWISSGTGHYITVRLWKECLLLVLVAGCLYLLLKDKALRQKFLRLRLSLLIIVYCLLSLVWGFAAYGLHKVTLKALGYGVIVNSRFLVFFLAVWLIVSQAPSLKKLWPKLLLIPAAVVIFFGLLQRLVLPIDFLKHFGYGPDKIYPYETINHNIHYLRVMSTLRGANPLGAYLVLILSAIGAYFSKVKSKRWLYFVFGLSGLLALFYSYSRGAWVGTFISLILLAWLSIKSERTKGLALMVSGTTLLIVATVALTLKNNATFQNYLFHTQKNSQVAVSSNASHVSAFRSGLHDLTHNPIGEGVGTAGPASVYNNDKTRIAEDYYIQVAQEVGWLGLALFLAINFLVARELWFRRGDPLAAALLASFIGLVFVNLVSHAWTDDTLAYLWWGLAGVALSPILDLKHNHNAKQT